SLNFTIHGKMHSCLRPPLHRQQRLAREVSNAFGAPFASYFSKLPALSLRFSGSPGSILLCVLGLAT
ncbi:MAG: hypothetical protein ACHQIK_21215, partial [Candidatus Acidiferrales bacterium]